MDHGLKKCSILHSNSWFIKLFINLEKRFWIIKVNLKTFKNFKKVSKIAKENHEFEIQSWKVHNLKNVPNLEKFMKLEKILHLKLNNIEGIWKNSQIWEKFINLIKAQGLESS